MDTNIKKPTSRGYNPWDLKVGHLFHHHKWFIGDQVQ